MANGFLSLAGVVFLLAIYAFFKITTEDERRRWARYIAAVFIVGLIAVTLLEWGRFIQQ